MSKISGGKYTRSNVNVDNLFFEGCEFTDCILRYAGGELPSFVSCKFTRVRWAFDGAASNTVTLMAQLYHIGFEDAIEKTFEIIRTYQPDPSRISRGRKHEPK